LNYGSTEIEQIVQIQSMNEKSMFALRLKAALTAAGYVHGDPRVLIKVL
jgi:hypothetical protein